MTKDTDRTPQTPAAAPGEPTNRPVVPGPAADAGTGAARPSDDAPARPPQMTTPASPGATAPSGAADTGRTAPGALTGETNMGRTPHGTATGETDTGRTAPGTPTGETDTGRTASGHEPDSGTQRHSAPDAAQPLLPTGDQDKLALRLQQAVTDFVESPHRAVEEAESTFDAVVTGLTDALQERRRTLHVAGRDSGDPGTRTEELRVTLQHYRDITERLLKV
ncbi:hypothetical protein E6P78_06040 [Streptomyces sp. A0958]|uniref:hypothetical protein n=1 Tax=Streptomyces sp. A0958 TaxID=2563101 RepID=UPI00109ECD86|nr:hypothetical protein [Streptomyces sp. A0958]THA71483.1 hypothetical protein E6P78_06040 [Streptomyces sp. A0958]